MKVHLDFETRSAADIRRCGGMRYAQDPTTEVLLAAYRFDAGKVKVWRRGDPPPHDLLDAVRDGATVIAHNAMFEIAIWRYVCEARLGWPALSPYQMDCTMSRAYAMALPGSLEDVCKLLNVKHQKDVEGHRLMLKMCKPRKPVKGEPDDVLLWHETPEQMDRLAEYCENDVLAECALDEVLPQLTPTERDIYQFDLNVNLRGFRLDVEMMRRFDKLVAAAAARLDARMSEVTGGAVAKTSQVARLKAWLADRGFEVDSLGRGEFDELLTEFAAANDAAAAEALRLRRWGGKVTSLAKYRSGIMCAGEGQRARGLLVYHKASTGRWAGSLYQPHNLERIDPDRDADLVSTALDIVRDLPAADAIDVFEACGIEPLAVAGKCTRAMIVAPPKRLLIGCDFSNVEGRGSAWLAGEHWKVDAFRAYDAGTGPDLYKLAYSRAFGVPVEKIGKGRKRQIGKVMELALGYQGSVGAFIAMAANYGVKPADLVAPVAAAVLPETWATTADGYEGANTYGLPLDQWTAVKCVVNGWRAAHGRTVQCWWDLQDAVVEAVSDPGYIVTLFDGRVAVWCARNQRFMHIRLPSGRVLSYFRPKVVETERFGSVRRQVVVEGRDSRRGGVWSKVHLYGGILWENVVQAMCRDLLAHGVMAVERQLGAPLVLHVHDEGVFETEDGTVDPEAVREVMSVTPRWAAGFPLSSAAWADARYVK